jgi:hypothetical protein
MLYQFSLCFAWPVLFAASSICRLFAGSTQWQHGLHLFSLFLVWPALFAADLFRSILREFLGDGSTLHQFNLYAAEKKKKKTIPRRDDGVSLPRWQLQSPMS